MKIQTFLLNRTYIAQDRVTGLTAYADNEQTAVEKLTILVNEYWDKKKIVVQVNSNAKLDK